MSPRDWRFRLEDICDSLERIEEYVKGHDRDTWKADRKTFDAVVRNLEIIGEAVARIPDDIQALNQQIPWYKGLGNSKYTGCRVSNHRHSRNAVERESRIFAGCPIKPFGHDDNEKWYF